MPRYEWDPSKTQSSIEVFPKGEYEVVVGEPKSFIRKNRKNEDSYGIRFSLTVADGPYRGKRTIYTAYLHSEGAQSMAKRFQMAVFGFHNRPDSEKEFNERTAGLDWSFDPETGQCGEGWRQMAGAHVIANVDVQKNPENDEENQNFKSWRPAVAVASK